MPKGKKNKDQKAKAENHKAEKEEESKEEKDQGQEASLKEEKGSSQEEKSSQDPAENLLLSLEKTKKALTDLVGRPPEVVEVIRKLQAFKEERRVLNPKKSPEKFEDLVSRLEEYDTEAKELLEKKKKDLNTSVEDRDKVLKLIDEIEAVKKKITGLIGRPPEVVEVIKKIQDLKDKRVLADPSKKDKKVQKKYKDLVSECEKTLKEVKNLYRKQ